MNTDGVGLRAALTRWVVQGPGKRNGVTMTLETHSLSVARSACVERRSARFSVSFKGLNAGIALLAFASTSRRVT